LIDRARTSIGLHLREPRLALSFSSAKLVTDPDGFPVSLSVRTVPAPIDYSDAEPWTRNPQSGARHLRPTSRWRSKGLQCVVTVIDEEHSLVARRRLFTVSHPFVRSSMPRSYET
jgi:hypothetical protein